VVQLTIIVGRDVRVEDDSRRRGVQRAQPERAIHRRKISGTSRRRACQPPRSERLTPLQPAFSWRISSQKIHPPSKTAVLQRCRPDWDITSAEQRAAWAKGEKAPAARAHCGTACASPAARRQGNEQSNRSGRDRTTQLARKLGCVDETKVSVASFAASSAALPEPRCDRRACGRSMSALSESQHQPGRVEMARLLSVNVGLPRDISWKGRQHQLWRDVKVANYFE
jgi:hypothetical protein